MYVRYTYSRKSVLWFCCRPLSPFLFLPAVSFFFHPVLCFLRFLMVLLLFCFVSLVVVLLRRRCSCQVCCCFFFFSCSCETTTKASGGSRSSKLVLKRNAFFVSMTKKKTFLTPKRLFFLERTPFYIVYSFWSKFLLYAMLLERSMLLWETKRNLISYEP